MKNNKSIKCIYKILKKENNEFINHFKKLANKWGANLNKYKQNDKLMYDNYVKRIHNRLDKILIILEQRRLNYENKKHISNVDKKIKIFNTLYNQYKKEQRSKDFLNNRNFINKLIGGGDSVGDPDSDSGSELGDWVLFDEESLEQQLTNLKLSEDKLKDKSKLLEDKLYASQHLERLASFNKIKVSVFKELSSSGSEELSSSGFEELSKIEILIDMIRELHENMTVVADNQTKQNASERRTLDVYRNFDEYIEHIVKDSNTYGYIINLLLSDLTDVSELAELLWTHLEMRITKDAPPIINIDEFPFVDEFGRMNKQLFFNDIFAKFENANGNVNIFAIDVIVSLYIMENKNLLKKD